MKISVVIPVYNKAEYLAECLENILQQDFEDFEAICVDDGSTDNSGAICDEWARKDGRIRVIHTANGGVTAARRNGVEVASGKYIVFVDADDKLMPEALTTLHQAIETSGADEVIGTFCTQEGVFSPVVHEGLQPDTDGMIRAIVTGKKRFPILWAVIFRKEILEGCLGISREIIEGEDLMMQVQVLMKQPRVWFIRDCVYWYNLGLPNARRHTLERARFYDQILRDTLAPKWPTMQTAYVLHQLKECEQFIVEGHPEVKKSYYQEVIGPLPQGIPLYNRLVWHLPPTLSLWLIRLYKKIIRIKQHNL